MPDPENKDVLNRNDHDLLIRVDTKLDRAGTDIAELHKHISLVNSTVQALVQSIDAKITAAVSDRASKAELLEVRRDNDAKTDDHEKRIRRLERLGWMAVGILGLVEIVVRFVHIG